MSAPSAKMESGGFGRDEWLGTFCRRPGGTGTLLFLLYPTKDGSAAHN